MIEQQVSTTMGTSAAVPESAVQEFKSRLRGDLIRPDDAGYHAARQVYNGMIDKHPALIARCANVADVIAAVNFARQRGLTLAVRGGGHHGAGLGSCDDGLVIDLAGMRGVRVDPAAKTARAEGGCLLGDVDHATHAFGLATPFGIMSTTGVGGLTLGGGLGNLTRTCGLSIDNLLEADVVLADGRLVTASEREHADLFWALRGGGGNFGVVTSFLFKLHPVGTVYGGPMIWPIEQAAEIMRWYRDFIVRAPEELNGWFAFLNVPPGPPFPEVWHAKNMCAIVWCCTAPTEQAEELFRPIRQRFPPAIDFVGSLPYDGLQSMFDALYPPGLQWYWRADFVNELSDEAIARHLEYGAQLPTLLSTMHLYPINGAVHRVGKNDTAFSYRNSTWGSVIAGIDPDPANATKIKDWTVAYWEALHPYSAGGAYVNMMMDEGQERVQASYRDNYARLAKVKSIYDPTNLFHVNQNIKPTA
ncbi:MAG TPA: FAD-binding oxidoreductase [Roseiflexaceae bacterium]|nr:FAD-binding oxidoreductase [Roseiflexaceae bacterium]